MEKIRFEDIELSDQAVDEFDDHDELYFSISREKAEGFFEAAPYFTPCNPDDEEDDSYVEGDIIFSFERGSDDISEITLAPVYEDEDGSTDGDFISLDDDDFTPECLERIKKILHELRAA